MLITGAQKDGAFLGLCKLSLNAVFGRRHESKKGPKKKYFVFFIAGVDLKNSRRIIRASLEGTKTFLRHRSLKIDQAIRVGAD